MSHYYLRTDIQAEPIINHWYAWHLLINPATYALISKKLHVPIMESYIQSPIIHLETVKKKSMRGGPFIDFAGESLVDEITSLLNQTKQKNKSLYELADAFIELNQMLIESASGHSLTPLYEKIPKPLKGYIELVYDLNHNASFRILESLLFRSDYYNQDGQELLFSKIFSDERAFVISTPRVSKKGQLSLKTPFKDNIVDKLFSSKYKGIVKQDLLRIFEYYFDNTEENFKLFWSLFSEKKPSLTENFQEIDKLKIRYYGHACVLLETTNVTILIDPLISYNYGTEIERYTFDDLPNRIDYVLLTHAHQDHVMLETLLQIRHKVTTFIVPKNIPGSLQDPSLKLTLQNIGFNNVIEIGELDTISIPNGEIIGFPFLGEHADLNIASKIAYFISLNKKKLLFLADSNNLEPCIYEYLSKIFGKLDLMFLGMECEGAPMSWLYGPLFLGKVTRSMDQSRRLDGSDAKKAWDLIRAFDCKNAYIYAMGQEPWLSYITSIFYTEKSKPIIESNKLMTWGKENNINIERLYLKKEIIL